MLYATISQAHREVWLMDRTEADGTSFSTKGQLKVLIVSLRHFVKLHLSCLFGLPGLVKALGVRDPHQALAVGGQGDFFVCTKAHASALRIVLSQARLARKDARRPSIELRTSPPLCRRCRGCPSSRRRGWRGS